MDDVRNKCSSAKCPCGTHDKVECIKDQAGRFAIACQACKRMTSYFGGLAYALDQWSRMGGFAVVGDLCTPGGPPPEEATPAKARLFGSDGEDKAKTKKLPPEGDSDQG